MNIHLVQINNEYSSWQADKNYAKIMLKLVWEQIQIHSLLANALLKEKRATIVIKPFAYFKCCTELFYLAIRTLRLSSLKSIPMGNKQVLEDVLINCLWFPTLTLLTRQMNKLGLQIFFFKHHCISLDSITGNYKILIFNPYSNMEPKLNFHLLSTSADH